MFWRLSACGSDSWQAKAHPPWADVLFTIVVMPADVAAMAIDGELSSSR